MILKSQNKGNNRIFVIYLIVMFALVILRYLMRINIPAVVFLLVSALPICFGSISEQMAFVASCIPLSVAFQYKYALLILTAVIMIKKQWRLKASGVFGIVIAMMIWEFWHVFYGYFSYMEYLRDFAELIFLGVVTSIDAEDLDHKLVIRGLSVSVVGICAVMLFMQLQQFGFDLMAVFARSAHSFRFGQNSLETGTFALKFNANNLGFICNLSVCGSLLLAARKEHRLIDIILAICSVVFAMMTLSRAAIVCAVMIFGVYLIAADRKSSKKILGVLGGLLIAITAFVLLRTFIPAVLENVKERFQRKDVWNGRGSLLHYYWLFLLHSPTNMLFGVGMQGMYEKVSRHYPVHDVPHMGFQEVWVAWGVVGLVMLLMMLWKIIVTSQKYAGGKRQLYQYMPFVLTIVYTTSGQLLTSSRALMALSFAYICLCIGKQSEEIVIEG